ACRAGRWRTAGSEADAGAAVRPLRARPRRRDASPPRRRSWKAAATARTTDGRPGTAARPDGPTRRGPSGAQGARRFGCIARTRLARRPAGTGRLNPLATLTYTYQS